MTPEVIERLRTAYIVGANDKEAYGFADISHETFYNYIERHPEFREQINRWQEEPILKAKTTVVNKLNDVKNAQWYLERKAKKEYGANVDVTTDGKALPTPIIDLTNVQQDDSNQQDTEAQQTD